jgi:hypothetical protein
MKKVNLGITLSLISGVAAASTPSVNVPSNDEQEYSLSKALVKPDTQIQNLYLAQGGKGGNGGSVGPGNGGNGGNGGKGGNAGSSSGGDTRGTKK